jgi:hypothetical protein
MGDLPNTHIVPLKISDSKLSIDGFTVGIDCKSEIMGQVTGDVINRLKGVLSNLEDQPISLMIDETHNCIGIKEAIV